MVVAVRVDFSVIVWIGLQVLVIVTGARVMLCFRVFVIVTALHR